jgi:hypothetical protein
MKCFEEVTGLLNTFLERTGIERYLARLGTVVNYAGIIVSCSLKQNCRILQINRCTFVEINGTNVLFVGEI